MAQQNQPQRSYGWIKNNRLLPIQQKVMGFRIADIIDLTYIKPAVVDQLQVGRCMGCGVGAQLSGRMSALGLNPGNAFYFSPDDIYNGARKIEGTLSSDSGSMAVDGYSWIHANGVILYNDWPISATLSTLDPSTIPAQEMILPNFTPVGLDASSSNCIASILETLADGNLVAIGANFFLAWESYKSGVVPLQRPGDQIAGGHEWFIYKADSIQRIFYCQNSWGINYGENGCFQVPFDQLPILADMGMDLHYAIFDAPFDPAPPVPPVPTPSQPCCGIGKSALKIWVNSGVSSKLDPRTV